MGNVAITVQYANVSQKVSLLRNTKESLSEDIITPLQFGCNYASKTSKGDSVVSMESLNAELDAVAKKLALLVDATAAFLEKANVVFDETDRALS